MKKLGIINLLVFAWLVFTNNALADNLDLIRILRAEKFINESSAEEKTRQIERIILNSKANNIVEAGGFDYCLKKDITVLRTIGGWGNTEKTKTIPSYYAYLKDCYFYSGSDNYCIYIDRSVYIDTSIYIDKNQYQYLPKHIQKLFKKVIK